MKENDESLIWTKEEERELLKTPVFTVVSQSETAKDGTHGEYIALDAPDCVVVIPEIGDDFLLVRQWRHGAARLTAEFPGGVIDRGEEPAAAAERELLEETGYRAGKLTLLGECSPNPALFRSRFFCFLAEELVPGGGQRLDRDEFINVDRVKKADVIEGFGSGELTHAFTGTALMFYMRRDIR